MLRTWTAPNETCFFGVWAGYGILRGAEMTNTYDLPGREYLLYSGTIDLALARLDDMDQSPNLWWPENRAWFVATEIDYAWTYVGGTATLIESVLAANALEALPARLTDKPFFDSDTLNAALDAQ